MHVKTVNVDVQKHHCERVRQGDTRGSRSMKLSTALLLSLDLWRNVFAQEETNVTEAATPPPDPNEDPFEVLIKRCDGWKFPEESFVEQSDKTKVYLKVARTADGPFKDQNITKFLSVYGIHIVGDEEVPDNKLEHVGNVMAKVLDRDGDGKPDNQELIDELSNFHPILFLISEADRIMTLMNAQNADEGFPLELKFCPFAFDFEDAKKINPGGGEGDATCDTDEDEEKESENDRTLAFVLDHLMGRGFASVLGEPREEELTRIYKESLDAGTFEPENTGCPPESDECGRVMYASWGLSTLLGFDKCWCEQAQALKFCDADKLKAGEPELVDLLGSLFPGVKEMKLTEPYDPKDKSHLEK